GEARPDGQPDVGPAVEPAARAPRRERLRDEDAGQAGGSRAMTDAAPALTLYDCSTAPSPRRARIVLAEKGVRHATVQVDLRSGEQFGDAYRRINPQCTVPALVTDDGLVLTDNAAI